MSEQVKFPYQNPINTGYVSTVAQTQEPTQPDSTPLLREMRGHTAHYLVIKTGYEGIEELIGLFDEEGAISKIKAVRARYVEDADFYCVQYVDEQGAKCVCDKLGVNPSKVMLR